MNEFVPCGSFGQEVTRRIADTVTIRLYQLENAESVWVVVLRATAQEHVVIHIFFLRAIADEHALSPFICPQKTFANHIKTKLDRTTRHIAYAHTVAHIDVTSLEAVSYTHLTLPTNREV